MTDHKGKFNQKDADHSSAHGFASPPCFMHEAEPAWLGYLGRVDVLDLLNTLLEGERAGARGLGVIGHAAPTEYQGLLTVIARDEAHYCAMLTRHIERLGGQPSRETGSFFDKLVGTEGFGPRIDLLDRGQGWVVRMLRDVLPRIDDEALRLDLQDMLEVHERNIARCNEIPR